ncbi:MAG: hypothetical protein ACLT38_09330 [Akkermansia sp.]
MKHILAMLLALLGASGALAQIYVKVVPEKKTFLSGEAMYMRLTITNNSGVPVELKSREYSSWLDIHVEHSTAGAELPQSKFALFPPLKVPAGMSVSRKIDLRHFYDLSREGNYHVQAVVKMPNQKDMFASQKSLFAVRTGTPMWSQTVAIPASAKRCTFSICTIAVRESRNCMCRRRIRIREWPTMPCASGTGWAPPARSAWWTARRTCTSSSPPRPCWARIPASTTAEPWKSSNTTKR